VDLVLADRQGIEIDYCPQCRGIWLDRGELDKIIERNAAYEASVPPTQTGPAYTAPGPVPAPGYAQPAPWGLAKVTMAKATGVGTMGADTTADISVAGFLAGCFGTDRQSCPA
jgi:hypothetical protein